MTRIRPIPTLASAALAALMVVSPGLAYSAEAADPVGEVTWAIVPADAAGVPDQRVSYRLDLDPGATVTEHALVTNFSAEPVTFDIVAADGVLSPTGAFDLLPPEEESRGVGAWVEVQPTVDVPAGGSVVVPFTLTVPENATPGDHPGGIVAGITRTGDQAEGPQVGVNTRVGVRIHLRVAGEITPAFAFSDVSTSYEMSWNPFAPGRLHVEYTVANEGNVRLSSIQQFTALGPFGLPTGAEGPSGTVIGKQREILPGQTTKVEQVLETTWPLGLITTTLRGTQDSVGEDAPLRQLDQETVEAVTWAIPWMQLLVLLVLALLVFAFVKLLKGRRAKQAAAIHRAREEGAREAAARSGTTVDPDAATVPTSAQGASRG
jgi:Bacterial protein of unknown function (DUF916)